MSISATLRRVQTEYAAGQDRPLKGYLAAMSTFAGAVGLATAVGRHLGVRLPERFALGDVALVSVATYKASRLATKGSVTSALRAPFTRYEEPAGNAEVNESVRGDGVRHAVGELVTCPFCSGVWIAGTLVGGLVFAPRATRLVATALTAIAASDVLHIAVHRLDSTSD
ncbi:DUF1360 domain-containing protein [Saccharothrix longispora]|uniref:DUF1360 domain-containing protein n=1 Tax=Saccharothrix longispora TaxID=33920 RepID=UPI0028FD8FE2|nr:DUF1360 domain-containing protein [Saccharothrix longispora]MDU0294724.1 DUF1360 domain-containing protein [Saccharothrix longispora]